MRNGHKKKITQINSVNFELCAKFELLNIFCE